MIYKKPKFMPAGDRYISIEFGNEMTLELNFIAQELASLISENTIDGIIETAPAFASLLVHYEPGKIKYADLICQIEELLATLGSSDEIELESRLFYLPTLYLDPWTKACVEEYQSQIAEKTPDPEFLVQENGLDNVEQLVNLHSLSEYWVAALGFWPGLPFLMPLNPRSRLSVPKYDPPRTDTPKGAIGIGGSATSIYPVATPGGYQIIARTPVPIWDWSRKNPAFHGEMCLFRPGDRVKFVPITRADYDSLEKSIASGKYDYSIVEYQKFITKNYKIWAKNIEESIAQERNI